MKERRDGNAAVVAWGLFIVVILALLGIASCVVLGVGQ